MIFQKCDFDNGFIQKLLPVGRLFSLVSRAHTLARAHMVAMPIFPSKVAQK